MWLPVGPRAAVPPCSIPLPRVTLSACAIQTVNSLAHPFKPYTLTLRPHPKLAMSFFGRAPQAPSGSINPQQIEMAEAELSMISDIFDRIVRSCHSKCISEKYAEPDLNKGEGVCIDRCVAKFFEVNAKVGERMQTMGGAAQAGGSFGQ
ncbi:protein transporter [Phaffia rhodozyma]|uniref:Mitochondrial import inner membrane translocase subunit n=1 Tax=Phaffia rhodozyma TaxID=264483 RepID=A0A0F7SHX6_PHARH|nr:protein transporter [Phaffia rhodozyma]